MKKAIIFSGIKHSGKTLFARNTAHRLSLPFFDMDDLILKRNSVSSIREFYIERGKAEFMSEELASYLSLSSPPFVLSLGGGAADNTLLLDEIKKREDLLIYLKRDEKLLLPVILKDGVPPFLDKEDIRGSFHELYVRRDRIYSNSADIIIDLGQYGDKEEKTNLILEKIREAL